MLRIIVASFLLMFSLQAYAVEQFFVTGGLGTGEADFKPLFSTNGEERTSHNFVMRGTVGGRVDNGLQAELGIAANLELDGLGVSENATVVEKLLLLGYRLRFGEVFSLTPKVGYSSWELQSKERVVYATSETDRFEASGDNVVYALTATYDQVFVSYQTADYDFGPLYSLSIGMEFNF